MPRPECEKSKSHSRQKKFSGRSQRDFSLKDIKHGSVTANVFGAEATLWSTVDMGHVTRGREAVY